MTSFPSWLPVPLQFTGDWSTFLSEIYAVFERDFKDSRPIFQGRQVVHDSTLEYGKEAAFWHLVSRIDAASQERVPDPRRCERIVWPRPIMQQHADAGVSVWKNVRKRQTRVLIWLEQADYIVVLAERARATVLVTGYLTDRIHTRRKLTKERDDYYNVQKPPSRTA